MCLKFLTTIDYRYITELPQLPLLNDFAAFQHEAIGQRDRGFPRRPTEEDGPVVDRRVIQPTGQSAGISYSTTLLYLMPMTELWCSETGGGLARERKTERGRDKDTERQTDKEKQRLREIEIERQR